MKSVLLLILLSSAAFSLTKDDSLKTALIEKYLVTEGQKQMSYGFFEKQVSDSKGNFSTVPDSAWNKVRAGVHDSISLYRGTIGIFSEMFTLKELKDLAKAMEIPAMKRYIAFMSTDSSRVKFESMATQLGRDISGRIEKYLRDNKYLESKDPPEIKKP